MDREILADLLINLRNIEDAALAQKAKDVEQAEFILRHVRAAIAKIHDHWAKEEEE